MGSLATLQNWSALAPGAAADGPCTVEQGRGSPEGAAGAAVGRPGTPEAAGEASQGRAGDLDALVSQQTRLQHCLAGLREEGRQGRGPEPPWHRSRGQGVRRVVQRHHL